mgnify:CR=1 FL=1
MEKTIILQDDIGFKGFISSSFTQIRESVLERGDEWNISLKKYTDIAVRDFPNLPVDDIRELILVRKNPTLPWCESNVRFDYIHVAVFEQLKQLSMLQ